MSFLNSLSFFSIIYEVRIKVVSSQFAVIIIEVIVKQLGPRSLYMPSKFVANLSKLVIKNIMAGRLLVIIYRDQSEAHESIVGLPRLF